MKRKMRITLVNFRKWKNHVFTFNDGVTLLKGESGVGKTSIVSGMLFALFGEGRRVVRHGARKCKVVLEIQDMVIERTKNPNSLIVMKDDKTWNDHEAQLHINKVFGSVFPTTNYIAQNGARAFLNLSPSERLAFLENFMLSHIDISTFKSTLKERSKKTQSKLSNIHGQLKMLTMYKKNEPEFVEEPEEEYSESLLGQVYKDIEKVQKRITVIETQETEMKERSEELEGLEQELENVPKHEPTSKLQNRLELMEDAIQQTKKYRKRITLEEEMASISYEEPWTDKSKAECEEVLHTIRQRKTLQIKLKNLPTPDSELLNKTKRQLQRVRAKDLVCPECNAHLSYVDGELMVRDDVGVLCDSLEHLSLNISKLEEAERVARELHSLGEVDDSVQSYYNQQLSIEKKNFAEQQRKKRLERELRIIGAANEPKQTYTYEECDDLKKQIALHQAHRKQRVILEKKIQKVRTRIKILEGGEDTKYLLDQRDKLMEEMEHLNNLRKQHCVYTQYMEELKEWTEYDTRVKELNMEEVKELNYLEALTIFRNKLEHAENKAILSLLEDLNQQARVYMEAFFDEPIYVSIEMFRETGKKMLKPQVNVSIFYRGNDKFNLADLSGGEFDRVVLAFTLAFAELNCTNLILLDECISSLDTATCFTVMEGIRESWKGKYMIFIAHQITEGIFDHVVDVRD